MTARRIVRVTQQFFDRLDELLPADRGANAEPSATDFLLHELPTVIDRLAEDYERCTVATSDIGGVRAFISSGTLVTYFAVYTELTDDEAVVIFYFELDRWSSGTDDATT